jgi:hypothetical protein
MANCAGGIKSTSTRRSAAARLRLVAVHDAGKRLDHVAVHEDVELHEVVLAVAASS